MKKLKMMILPLAVLILAGCGGISYPELYVVENLPQYKDAKITQVVKNGPTLKDGVLFLLESSRDVKTIASYFDEQMKNSGWTVPEVNVPTESSYATQYEKGEKYIQLTVSQMNGKNQTISINFSQK